jgi:ubiquinone/menaquinone biosynthesis C-methylase UbiE
MEEGNITPAEMFDRYFGPALFTPWAHVLLQHAAPQPGERVLDLACGTGTVARLVAPVVGESGKVVGVDINPNMLTVARERPSPQGAPIEWREGDAIALDLPDGAFDLVLCQQGLQFFPDRSTAAREMMRVLADGGRLALDLWQALDKHPLFEALVMAEVRRLNIPVSIAATPFTLADEGELRALLSEAGFKRIEVVPKTLEVQFPSPERFVYLTLFAAAAVLEDFEWNDVELRSNLIEEISREIEPVVQRYRTGDTLTFPMSCNIAVAYR